MSESASGTIRAVQLGPGDYQYTVTLTDTGTTPIGTLWFSWVPGAGYLPNLPSFSSPTGWTAHLTNGPPPGDGYSIQWVASAGSALQPGQSFGAFTFTSATAPSAMDGNSTIHPGVPVLTSFVYSGAPFSDSGVEFDITPAPAPKIADWSDLNGDGMSDALLRNASSGETYLWTMNGATVAAGAPTSTQVGENWRIAGIGDFNGDGAADLLWVYNNSANAADPLNGVSYLTFQNGAAATNQSGVVQQVASEWQVQGVGDFDGDGKADVLYRSASTGETYIDIMNGTQATAASGFTSQQATNPNWQVAATGDFSGAGHADILWQYDNSANASDPLNGDLYMWAMNGTNVVSATPLSQEPGSANWQVAGTGDFDGNGTSDLLFRYDNAANASDPLNGVTYLDFMNGATVTNGAPTQWQVDESWQVASIGDFNGDGKSDILFQQASTGDAYLWTMNGANVAAGGFTSTQPGSPSWTVQNGVHIG